MSEKAINKQIAGDHYRLLGIYQPVEVLKRWLSPEEFRGYMKGTAIAYLAREQQKGKDTDIAKALHTLELFEELKSDQSTTAVQAPTRKHKVSAQ